MNLLKMPMKIIKGRTFFFTGIFLLFLVGCGSYQPMTNTVFIEKNGAIREYLVEDFSVDLYDIDEWKKEAEEEIADYNRRKSSNGIYMENVLFENSVLEASVNYADDSDYEEFNGVLFFEGTITEAMAEGLTVPKSLNGTDGSTIITAELDKDSTRIVVYDIASDVVVPGNVKGISDNLTTDDVKGHVITVNDDGLSYIIY